MNRRGDRGSAASDESLLADFLSGDHGSFEILVERHSEDLFRFVSRFIRNSAAAEDVVQETFVQVFQSAAGFDASRRFRPWLFTIAANKARDFLRSRLRKRELPLSQGAGGDASDAVSYLDFLSDDEAAPDSALEAEETRRRVGEVVARMPDNLREVLMLGYFQRFAYKEIADILSIPLGTVKSRLHAAVSHFAQQYRKLEESGSRGRGD
ncbi:MAG: RNA polymerase subunit sigma-70 [Planctomycetota bacterium]|nr:MAG: RNA polymerase subunit sigma-70 [Planctomycetota bacterium]